MGVNYEIGKVHQGLAAREICTTERPREDVDDSNLVQLALRSLLNDSKSSRALHVMVEMETNK